MTTKRTTAERPAVAISSARRAVTETRDPLAHVIQRVEQTAEANRPGLDKIPSYFVWERVYATRDLVAYVAMIGVFFLFTVIAHYAF